MRACAEFIERFSTNRVSNLVLALGWWMGGPYEVAFSGANPSQRQGYRPTFLSASGDRFGELHVTEPVLKCGLDHVAVDGVYKLFLRLAARSRAACDIHQG